MIKVKPIQYISNIMLNVNAMELSFELEKHCSSQNEECSLISSVSDRARGLVWRG